MGCNMSCLPRCCVGRYDTYKYYKETKDRQIGCCANWCFCCATGIYMNLPTYDQPDTFEDDVDALYKSMKGLGTDDAELCRILTTRSHRQIDAIRLRFNQKYGSSTKKQNPLDKWIKSDTSGDWRKLLLYTIENRAVRDAQLLRKSMKGIGTDDEALIEIMTTRSAAHMEEINEQYTKLFSTTLQDDIKGDTSFNYKKTLLALSDRASFLAERLHDAIKGMGTDDDRVTRILTGIRRDNGAFREILAQTDDHFNTGMGALLEYECSMPDLMDVKKAYVKLYSRSLEEDISNDTSGNYKRALMTLIRDQAETDAEAFAQAMKGMGTNDTLLIEMATCRSPYQLNQAREAYSKMNEKSLMDAIKSDTSGDYKKLLQYCVMSRADNVASTLRSAMKGMGTDDNRLIAAVACRSRKELRDIKAAYFQLHQRDLEKDIKGDTSGWYENMLIYMFRQAEEDLAYVPHNAIKRLRDFRGM